MFEQGFDVDLVVIGCLEWWNFSGGGWWIEIMVLGKLMLCESCEVVEGGVV